MLTVMMDVPIRTETIDLDQLLKFAGLADSGGVAKSMICDGQVKVNGQTETRRRATLRLGDVVELEGAEPLRIVGG